MPTFREKKKIQLDRINDVLILELKITDSQPRSLGGGGHQQ